MSDGFLFVEGFAGDEDSLVWTSMMTTNAYHGRMADGTLASGYGLRAGQDGNAYSASPLWSPTSKLLVGFRFRVNDTIPTGSMRFFEHWGPGALFWSWIGITPQMTLYALLGSDGAGMPGGPYTYSTYQLDLDTWYYLELSLAGNTAGNTLKIQSNGPAGTPGSTGAEILSATGAAVGYTPTFNQFRIGVLAGGGNGDLSFGDIYVRDGNVGGWVGDTQIVMKDLEDDRAVELTRLSGAKNYLMLNETAPDDDTTYNETTASPQSDFFEIADGVFTGTVHCVQLVPRARKTNTDIYTLETALDLSGTKAYGTPRYMAQAYETHPPDVFGDAPGKTGWTNDDLNDVGVGYRATQA